MIHMAPHLNKVMADLNVARAECHDDQMQEDLTAAFCGVVRASARLARIKDDVATASKEASSETKRN